MNQQSRRQRMLEALNARGEVMIAPLARSLDVSEMTVRRDLDALAAAGKVIRTHGGATLATRVAFEFNFMRKRHEQAAAKQRIAARAAREIPPGASVLLDSGTTTLAVARALRGRQNLRILTTSLPIASELQFTDHCELILLGGTLRRESPDLIGPLTETNLENLRADLAFIGADAVDAAGYVYNQSLAVARMLAKMTQAAQRVFILADQTKLDHTALARFGCLSAWDGLITDAPARAAALRPLRRAGIRILSATH
ncbi:MAG: DeoR/GlpR family DNA-binding transcription regulator [Candidatus Marinimicrobia bacterium]|nr:DeoR/GlpR family DNA-binding transcription regulator [Candidatus Neomarinimicrobiota bacterium]